MSLHTIKTVLKLAAGGSKAADIAVSAGVSESTVRRILRKSEQIKIFHAQAKAMEGSRLRELFAATPGPRPHERFPVDLERVAEGLALKRTVASLYGDYAAEAAKQGRLKPLGQAAFFKRVSDHLAAIRLKPRETVMLHKAGEYMYVDYCGDRIHLLVDGVLKECRVVNKMKGRFYTNPSKFVSSVTNLISEKSLVIDQIP